MPCVYLPGPAPAVTVANTFRLPFLVNPIPIPFFCLPFLPFIAFLFSPPHHLIRYPFFLPFLPSFRVYWSCCFIIHVIFPIYQGTVSQCLLDIGLKDKN